MLSVQQLFGMNFKDMYIIKFMSVQEEFGTISKAVNCIEIKNFTHTCEPYHTVFEGPYSSELVQFSRWKNDKYCYFIYVFYLEEIKFSLRNRFSLGDFILDHWSKISVLFLCVHGCYKFLHLKILTKRENF